MERRKTGYRYIFPLLMLLMGFIICLNPSLTIESYAEEANNEEEIVYTTDDVLTHLRKHLVNRDTEFCVVYVTDTELSDEFNDTYFRRLYEK